MSIKLMSQVWEQAAVNGSELLVLLALADYANGEDICWPSLTTLAKRARVSERQVQRIIQSLEAKEHLEVLERGNGAGHSSKYRLTIKGDIQGIMPDESLPDEPEKGDIQGNGEIQKGDIQRAESAERVTSSTERVTSSAQKVDIAMSPDPTKNHQEEPLTEEKEETHAGDSLTVAWQQAYGQEEIPSNLAAPLKELAGKCTVAAVIHGIKASAANPNGRNFKYIAECARNYVPPPPLASYASGSVYSNGAPELATVPGVVAMPATNGHKPPALPAPMPTSDPWAIVTAELVQAAPPWVRWLAGSYLESNGELAGEPFYRLTVTEPGANAEWLTQQAEPAIRKKLASVLGRRILLEITTERVTA